MSWNFFGSGHGKGEHDGAGAVIKRSLTQYQLQPDCPKLDCAADVVALLRQTLSDGATATYASQARYVSRVFWEIELGDVEREKNWDVKAVKNTRSMHSVSAYSEHDTTALRIRSLSCFCSACKQEKWRRCVSKSHVPFWTYLILEPTEEGEDDDDEINEDAAYEGHYDTLSQALIVGDNFVVIAPNDNEEKVDFYIVKCTTAIEEFHSDAEDDWGNIIGRGSYVVKGFYYCMINEKTYEILDKKPKVFIYSHLVCAIKIPMIPHPCNSKLYTISLDVSESIYNSMPFEL